MGCGPISSYIALLVSWSRRTKNPIPVFSHRWDRAHHSPHLSCAEPTGLCESPCAWSYGGKTCPGAQGSLKGVHDSGGFEGYLSNTEVDETLRGWGENCMLMAWSAHIHLGRWRAGTYSHHPFRKENDLPNLLYFCSMSIFRGVWVWKGNALKIVVLKWCKNDFLRTVTLCNYSRSFSS